ncbi:MAG: DUF58 domain-containing protein [Candidatus Hydrogenedentes bacterium]|nr:DUF58 domain-containing protein [Candidatus Hydrogenedentota bacterium]
MSIFTRFRRRRMLRGGQVFLVTAVLILLAAWNTGNNLYYLLFGSLASFVLVSAFLSGYSLRKLHIEREAPAAAHRDEAFALTIRIENRRRILPSISVRVENADAPGVSIGYVMAIPGKHTAIVRTNGKFEKRGVYELPDIVLVTSFPFGLIESRRRIRDPHEIVVYPRVHAVRTAVVEKSRATGEIPQISRGAGDEFFSLRDYIPGDDLRHIAWRASARSGTLLVKELEKQATRRVVFVFDSRRVDLPDFDDHFEQAIELVASLAQSLLNRQYAVALVTSSLSVGEGEGQAHALKILDALARLNPSEGDTPDPFLHSEYLQENRRVTYLFISPDPLQWGQYGALGQNRVLDPREVIHA